MQLTFSLEKLADPGAGVNKQKGLSSLRFRSYHTNFPLVLLSQKVATNDEENHLFGKIHTSAMGGWNGSAKIE